MMFMPASKVRTERPTALTTQKTPKFDRLGERPRWIDCRITDRQQAHSFFPPLATDRMSMLPSRRCTEAAPGVFRCRWRFKGSERRLRLLLRVLIGSPRDLCRVKMGPAKERYGDFGGDHCQVLFGGRKRSNQSSVQSSESSREATPTANAVGDWQGPTLSVIGRGILPESHMKRYVYHVQQQK